MIKGYKYRIYPTKEQEILFEQHFGASRFIYNWALETREHAYKTTGKRLSLFDLCNQATPIRKNTQWLSNIYPETLKFAIINMTYAYNMFFKGICDFPKFKSKKDFCQSFTTERFTLDFDKGFIKISKLAGGKIKTKFSRRFKDTGWRCHKRATISKTKTGKYFIGLVINDNECIPNKQAYDESTTIGIDVGIKDFAVLSTGEKIANPKYYKNSLARLKCLYRRFDRTKKGSKNRNKIRLKLANLHEKVRNRRQDFQHKLSIKLVCENQAIAVEDLDIEDMKQNRIYAQSVSDASWGSFTRIIEYKANWYGKTFLKIGRFEPSSKTCNVCGYHYKDLTLDIREWQCPTCNTKHDRDINAAINIKNFAFGEYFT